MEENSIFKGNGYKSKLASSNLVSNLPAVIWDPKKPKSFA